MASAAKHTDLEELRILLAFPATHMVLAEERDDVLRLPILRVPLRTRATQALVQVIKEKWDAKVVVIEILTGAEGRLSCVVVEVRSCDWEFGRHGLVQVQVNDIDRQDLAPEESLVVKQILVGETENRGPFSKLGWVEDAQAWIRGCIADDRVCFNDDIQQIAAGGCFALVRFGTNRGPAFWLKATGKSNAREFTVTQAIARYCPRFLPIIVATRTDWNAWVSEEAGEPMQNCTSLFAFEQATHSLAQLQIASAPHVSDLLNRGCCDLRLPSLRAKLPNLMRYLEAAMSRQTSTKVAPLNRENLCELGRLLKQACFAMEEVRVPDTLIHNDLNAGNILFDGSRVVYTDWSAASIGIPFLTFCHLQAQTNEFDKTHTWAPILRALYASHWRSALSESRIKRAFIIAPPLAIGSYLCGRDPMFTSQHRSSNAVLSYARSLARHMYNATQKVDFREALCQ